MMLLSRLEILLDAGLVAGAGHSRRKWFWRCGRYLVNAAQDCSTKAWLSIEHSTGGDSSSYGNGVSIQSGATN